jgi:hypothetical protein
MSDPSPTVVRMELEDYPHALSVQIVKDGTPSDLLDERCGLARTLPLHLSLGRLQWTRKSVHQFGQANHEHPSLPHSRHMAACITHTSERKNDGRELFTIRHAGQ